MSKVSIASISTHDTFNAAMNPLKSYFTAFNLNRPFELAFITAQNRKVSQLQLV